MFTQELPTGSGTDRSVPVPTQPFATGARAITPLVEQSTARRAVDDVITNGVAVAISVTHRPMTDVSSGAATQVAAPDHLVARALRLWSEPLADAVALDAFRAVYTDPVLVNGRRTDLTELIARARMLKSALAPIHHRIESTVVAPGRVAIAFTISGRLVGTLSTPFGEMTATHRDLAVTGLDIFELDHETGRVAAVWAVADWPALLVPTDATN
jgi:hypothetical protein